MQSQKQPLQHQELTDIIDLCLWAGQLLLQHGANSFRTEESVHHIGTGLGCDWLDVIITPDALIITASSHNEFRTKARRVVRFAVDMSRITAVNDLSRRIASGKVDRFAARQELEALDQRPSAYNRWVIIFMVGLACAAFSRLFGGDWAVFGVVFVAAMSAMFVRQLLHHHHFNPLLVVIVCAFVAGLLASSAAIFNLSPQPQLAMSASVLLLVPGVPLINAAQDIIRGYIGNGIARGGTGMLISLAIALGLLAAILLTGAGIS